MSERRSLSMEYDDASDSSGTDDDLPPVHSGGRASRGVRVSGNGRAATGPIYASTQACSVDLMVQKLEQEAYTAVLRAFGAQSEVITWAKERLMTDLRKELRVSDEQHRECLGKVASDDTLRQIQQLSAAAPGYTNSAPPPAVPANPASSQSRKKQKTAHIAQAALPPPHPPAAAPAPSVKSASAPPSLKRGAPPGQRGKKHKGGRGTSAPKGHRNSVGRPASTNKHLDVPSDIPIDPYVGRRVKTRWPEDNAFYEAVITDYNAELDAHALVYDMDTENETWEWINLKEVAPGDLKWVEGPNAVVTGRKAPPPGSRGGIGRGIKKTKGSVVSPGAGRQRNAGRGVSGRGWRNSGGAQNGTRSVELVPMEDLAKEVDKLGEEGKFESAKRAAKAQEEAIRKVLAEVGESSDEAESDDAARPPSSHTQSIDHDHDHDREERSRQISREHTVDSDEDETAGGDGSDGEHTTGAASDADDDQQGDDGDDKDEDG